MSGSHIAFTYLLDYDLVFLHQYAKTFPATPMAGFIEDYCRFFKLPWLPDEDEQPIAGPSQKVKRGKKGKAPNARERRHMRRAAKRDLQIGDDRDAEEREELIADMTVRCLHGDKATNQEERPGNPGKVDIRSSSHDPNFARRGGLGERSSFR